jgi:3-oxoacyl-[acyl-carrier protein] reductase
VTETHPPTDPPTALVTGSAAGIGRAAATMGKTTEEQFDEVIAVHAAAAIMRANERSAIVNMSATSGKVGMVGQTYYLAVKAGIVGMTKAASKEHAYLGVRFNAIQPGLIGSAMTEAMPQRIWDMTGTVLAVTGRRHL